MLLSARRRFSDSIEQITKAAGLDPLSRIITVHTGWPYYFARDFDAATRRFRKALELDERFIPAHGWLGMALGQQGRYDESIDAFQRALEVEQIPILKAMLAHTHAIAGNRELANALLAELTSEAKTRYISPYDIAVIHAGLGDVPSAIAQLHSAVEDRSAWMVFLNIDPRLDRLRHDPAIAEIAAKLG
jgi:tetratricopeptide (TPR) repeat protein